MARSSGILKIRRASGTRYRIRWFDAYGERRSETYGSESAARGALRQRQVEADRVRSGLARPRSEKRVAEASAEWLETRPAKRRRDDESRLRTHILPELGHLRLAEINPAVLDRFVRHLEAKRTARAGEKTGQPLRPMTIKNTLIVLCKMLGDLGFPNRVKYAAPTSGYEWIRRPEDVGRFLDACRPGWFRVAAALAVYAGLRKGEVAGLRRDALDFERGLLRVDRSYDGPTKSKHVRWVPLSPELASVLKPWLLSHPGELVVREDDGSPITPQLGLNGRARRAARRAGIAEVTFHQLRHTAASHLAQRVALPLVGAVLGHADPKTTARYAHLDTESVSRDARLHLTFTAPAGKVVALPSGNGPVMDPTGTGREDAVDSPNKLTKLP